MTDVIVIGAGPAGCAAAMLLARRGIAVTLIEQHRFPRDKVCGECLSGLGIDVLERLGVADALRAAEPAILTHTAVHTADGKSIRVRLPGPMWGVSRRKFDAMLLEHARDAGATIRQPARCEGMELSPGPMVRVRDLQSNEVASIRAEHVIVADGKGAVPAGSPIRTGDFGVKAHFMDVDGPRDTIELFGCRGLYGGVAAIEGGRWNVAFSVPAERLQGCAGDVAAVFDGITRENPILRGRMRNARPAGEWLVAPLPRFGVRKSWPAGVIPVGNAAAAIEPIGGEGMGLALRSAELAAASVIEGFDREIATVGGRVPVRRLNGNQVRGAFVSMWRTRAAACRAGAIVTSNPMLARVLVPLLNQRIVSHSMLRLMGKG